jgi:hypothetical protein
VRRLLLGLAVASALMSVSAHCDGNDETVVRTWAEAKTYLRELMDGTKPGEFKLAGDASLKVTALVDDGPELAALGEKAKGAGDWGCTVLDATSNLQQDALGTTTVDDVRRNAIKANAGLTAQLDGVDLDSSDYLTMDDIIDKASRLRHSELVALADAACAGKDI